MRVVFVFPAAEFSVWDVARGYRAALARKIGEDNIRDYYLNRRASYHMKALPEEQAGMIQVVSKLSSETVICEAMYFDADLVLIMSGLNFHPIGLWLLDKAKIPVGVVLTESPYEDENQHDWVSACPGMTVFTNERISASLYGWTYLQHAHDPAVHFPVIPSFLGPQPCDVLMVGTGWKERQLMLESIDWTGINLKLRGYWPDLRGDDCTSPLKACYEEGFIDNEKINEHYTTAKICLNFHRAHPTAESANPRVYEIPACGALQICDRRAEVFEVFGETVPTFETAGELEQLIHYYLAHDQERRVLAERARAIVRSHTFDDRIETLLAQVSGSRLTTAVTV